MMWHIFSKMKNKPFIECVWNVMAHGDAWEGKWRRNWWMEWVASTLTLPRNLVYPALLPLMRTPRLPAVDWTDAPADLNGLVRFGERRNLVSARVPSYFKCTTPLCSIIYLVFMWSELTGVEKCWQKVYIIFILMHFIPMCCDKLVVTYILSSNTTNVLFQSKTSHCVSVLTTKQTVYSFKNTTVVYRVIHKSLRNFRTWLRNNQDRHGRKEHINR